ncbi:hypothetical protein KUL25_21135 [Rhodobacteraceae bacterium N5(2021)]|uniref:Squalene cyclase C-terminal domain-containing protein n=1 Tax=Gymnodinialimonas phycosphaerae TaxID=2841589 RepID=A0A975TUE3_9RHOB|nr:hypothetical protein [Gymnodinialimonas phycosphaerae]MBY4895274.1 hypothetical protein [Gymnodinialimonas phycosphaerae]
MQQSLSTVFSVLAPVTGKSFPASVIADAQRIADVMPPVAKGGFEFDLLAPLTSVDVLQCFDVEGGGMRALATYLPTSRIAPGRALSCLEGLADTLSPTAQGWRAKTASVWLEVDAHTFTPDCWQPSVFLEFHKDARLCQQDLIDALGALSLVDLDAKVQVLRTIMANLEGDAHVSHLGAMLSRDDTPLRINIKRLTRGSFEGLLRALGLRVSSAPIATIIDDAYRTTLCLDVTDRPLPRVGAEFRFSAFPARERGWKSLTERAASRPLAPDSWNAMESWQAELAPHDMAGIWPDTMILADLAGGDDNGNGNGNGDYLALEAIPSHIKVTVQGDRLVSAKGYVGFQPTWRRFGASRDPARHLAPKAAVVSRAHDQDDALRDAMNRGLRFLLKERCQNGLWRDFDFAQRYSDEWVTGYVGTQVAAVGSPEALQAARGAWDQLRHRRPPGAGWGYQQSTPPDADSTAWALTLARDLGQDTSDHVSRGYSFLEAHRGDNGGFKTYSDAELARLGHSLPDTQAHRAWRFEQIELTASAARAGLDVAVTDLLRVQQADGSWAGSWMETSEYATGLATEALCGQDRLDAGDAIDRAIHWAARHLPAQHNSFKLAWLLRILASGPRADAAAHDLDAAIERLLQTQQANGSWPPGCNMMVPLPSGSNDQTRIESYLDCHGTFTTSTVVGTLALLVSEGC